MAIVVFDTLQTNNPPIYKSGGGGVYVVERQINIQDMKKILTTAIKPFEILIAAALLSAGCCTRHTGTPKDREITAQLKSFISQKTAQANGSGASPEINKFFTAAQKGDWQATDRIFKQISTSPDRTSGKLKGPAWEDVKEVWGGLEAFYEGNEKYSQAFGHDVIQSIPAGSIYFGGTDPGRFIVTALCPSQVNGEPFFVLTQNALADSSYLDYLHGMFDGKISLPTPADSKKCFDDYSTNAAQRLYNNQLKPGESVTRDANGQLQISGLVSVMEINGLLVKNIFDKNPDREFYIEESFPLDWMYPQLEPHGLIMKLNRQPLATLSNEIVSQDHDYWAKYVTPMIGSWLNSDTSVQEVADFAKKTCLEKNLSGFHGDPEFLNNQNTQKMFSKLRSSIAGLYVWRAHHSKDDSDKTRMAAEADFAFRQALALCPYSPEAVFRYVNFLLEQNRLSDALLIAETAAQMPPMLGNDGAALRQMIEQLKAYQHKGA